MSRARNGRQYRNDVRTAGKHFKIAAAWTNSPECEALDDEHARIEARWMAQKCGCELCVSVAKRLHAIPTLPVDVPERDRDTPQPEDDQPLHDQERDERS